MGTGNHCIVQVPSGMVFVLSSMVLEVCICTLVNILEYMNGSL